MVKKNSLPYYLSIADSGEEKRWILCLKGIIVKCNTNNLTQDLNSGHWLHFQRRLPLC